MWLQTLAQAAVFATIVGVFIAIAAWVNGRRTTRQIRETIEGVSGQIRETMEGMQRETNKLLSKLADQHEAMLKILERIEARIT